LLEAAAEPHGNGTYEFDLNTEAVPWTIETRPMLTQIAREISFGRPHGTVSRGFRDSVAHIIESVCRKFRERNGVDTVCLGGGAFQAGIAETHADAILKGVGQNVSRDSR
jgi:hydrogenase maturation protein HypF